MKIAYTMTDGRGELDELLFDLAKKLAERGKRTCGIVQVNSDRDDCHRCDMDVQVLPDGPSIRISQFLGKESTGCRLNPEALETAAGEVATRMQDPFDVFLLNKFGKQEADGRGFRELLGEALAQGATVIAGTNGMNKDAFEEFSGGIATYVAPDLDALLAFCDESEEAAA
ncbi:DUF2478 domain-containing protein [Shimia biformata]|uniref:DUF2478 domain-containing protein n=1 Tax=Shimia biformata TaxID=1294299 RepID=UPI00194DCF60|nr:DUF2478 domain-containing protein [Shimia biformata]